MVLQSTNFWGKDSMRWWIGQVTDPDSGEWRDSLEFSKGGDNTQVTTHRCRVRIVGCHGSKEDIADKDLPLAHVSLPSNISTVNGSGVSCRYQGGEVVMGFFADGDDGQCPIITNTLSKQAYSEDGDETLIASTSATGFFPANFAFQGPGKHQGGEDTNNQLTVNQANNTVGFKQSEVSTAQEHNSHNQCQDNELSKITDTIKKFTTKMAEIQDIGGTFIDPIFGGVLDIDEEIRQATFEVHNSVSKLVRRGRSWLIQETTKKLNEALSNNDSQFDRIKKQQAVEGITNIIQCNIEKVEGDLKDYLAKSLGNMVGQVLDIPVCAIENLMGDMFGQINNVLDSALGGIFGQLNNLIGSGLPLPSATFSKGIRFANILTNVLDCDRLNCQSPTAFSSRYGIRKGIEDSFDSIIENASLSSKISPLTDALDNQIAATPDRPNCNTSILKCGPPRVDILGGGGDGASGNAIINALGQVIGVAITEEGSGFETPPLISFVDGCNNGSGAGGYVRLSQFGSVKDVVITSSGSGYIPNTTETDLEGNVKEIIPDPNETYDGAISYVTTVDDCVVQNVGFNYEEGDTVSINGVEAELQIQQGRIIGVNIINGGFGFTEIPDVRINTKKGFGAELFPVLKFTKVDDAVQTAQITQDAVVTVIDCIHK